MCVWSNSDYKNHANASGADEGQTTERSTYLLTKNIVLVDNRCCSKMNTYVAGEIFVQLEVVPIVVLTHRNHENYTEVENMFSDIGVEKIFGVENYTDKNPRKKRETHEVVIQFLYEVISDAQFRVNYPRDADQEMIERKHFVLNYVHQREIKVHEANLGRQKDVENVRMEQTFRLRQQEEEARMQKNRDVHKERMERLQGEFARQRLRQQFEHQERMKRMEKERKTGKAYNKKILSAWFRWENSGERDALYGRFMPLCDVP
ncbi:uncharacterized protein [Phyllobates terribilis]|uniref:uncharacterized protein isoform X3 n=1 Tax=Phyllobates terribilis TaxID=111132 RepID=UPI003CCABFD5